VSSIDWARLEEVVERAVRKARGEELKEIAEAIKTLAEYMKTGFQEIQNILNEHTKILKEHAKTLEEHTRILEEHTKILNEHTKTLEEHTKILNEHTKILEEHTRILREHSEILKEHSHSLAEHTKLLNELKASMGSLGRRWGRDLERTVLEIYRDLLEKRGIEPGKVEKFVYRDVEGRYLSRGALIEVDVYIHDGKTYIIEVKSHVELDDVEWFWQKAGIVERILGKAAERKIIVSVNIDKEALERAKELDIDVIYGAVVE
jgi:hypothetical protein